MPDAPIPPDLLSLTDADIDAMTGAQALVALIEAT
jgi:hypothetical protein